MNVTRPSRCCLYRNKIFFSPWKELTCAYNYCFCLIFAWYKTTGCLSTAPKKTRTTVKPQIKEMTPSWKKNTFGLERSLSSFRKAEQCFAFFNTLEELSIATIVCGIFLWVLSFNGGRLGQVLDNPKETGFLHTKDSFLSLFAFYFVATKVRVCIVVKKYFNLKQ